MEKSPGAKSHYNQPNGDAINPPQGHRPKCVCACVSESVCFLIKFSRPRRFLHHYFISEHCDFSVFGFSFVCLSICLCACIYACVSMYLRVLSDKRAFNQTLEFLLSLIMCDLMMHRALLSSLKHKRSFCSSLSPSLSSRSLCP